MQKPKFAKYGLNHDINSQHSTWSQCNYKHTKLAKKSLSPAINFEDMLVFAQLISESFPSSSTYKPRKQSDWALHKKVNNNFQMH